MTSDLQGVVAFFSPLRPTGKPFSPKTPFSVPCIVFRFSGIFSVLLRPHPRRCLPFRRSEIFPFPSSKRLLYIRSTFRMRKTLPCKLIRPLPTVGKARHFPPAQETFPVFFFPPANSKSVRLPPPPVRFMRRHGLLPSPEKNFPIFLGPPLAVGQGFFTLHRLGWN